MRIFRSWLNKSTSLVTSNLILRISKIFYVKKPFGCMFTQNALNNRIHFICWIISAHFQHNGCFLAFAQRKSEFFLKHQLTDSPFGVHWTATDGFSLHAPALEQLLELHGFAAVRNCLGLSVVVVLFGCHVTLKRIIKHKSVIVLSKLLI